MPRKPNAVAALALLVAATATALLAAGCHGYKDNPDTCRTNQECPSGRCDLATFLCLAAGQDGGLDAPYGDGGQPDAPMGCSISAECTAPGAPLCVANRCQPCQAGPANACRTKSADLPVCNPASGRCTVQCSGPSDCTQPDAPFCVMNMCTPCAQAPADACRGRDPARPVCDPVSGRCGECADSKTCRAEAPICLAGTCVPCGMADATACRGRDVTTPVCEPAGRCLQCLTSAECADATPICAGNRCVACADPTAAADACEKRNGAAGARLCERASGKCVECTESRECTDGKPVCVAGRCSACSAMGIAADACGKRSAATPACEPTSGRCVQCNGASECTQAGAPLCVGNQCVACGAAGATADGCMKRSAAAPVCEMASGRCVECSTSAQCGDPAKPICANNVCVGCGGAGAPADGCAKKNSALPACDATSGRCVQCVQSAQCGDPAKPICVAQTCTGCQTDAQCAERGGGPGVCLEGPCASDAETVYVKFTDGACPGAGTAASPFCSLASVTSGAIANKRAIVVRGAVLDSLSLNAGTSRIVVVGQASATVIPPNSGAALSFSGGEVLVRNLRIAQGQMPIGDGVRVSGPATKVTLLSTMIEENYGVGLIVEAGSVVVNRSIIRKNGKGGAIVRGGSFDIVNTVFDSNGPGNVGPTNFGGVYVGAAAGKVRYTTVVSNKPNGVVCENAATPLTGILAFGNVTGGDLVNCSNTASKVGEDPRFDPARPYRITRQSPCFGAGGPDAPSDDIDGDPRPLDGAVDCGADEFKP